MSYLITIIGNINIGMNGNIICTRHIYLKKNLNDIIIFFAVKKIASFGKSNY